MRCRLYRDNPKAEGLFVIWNGRLDVGDGQVQGIISVRHGAFEDCFGVAAHFPSLHRHEGSTLRRHSYAQLGPPSLPVPGMLAMRTFCELIMAQVISQSGTFNLRLQGVFV